MSAALGSHDVFHSALAGRFLIGRITMMHAVGKAYRFYKRRGLQDTVKRTATVLLRRDSYKNYIRRAGGAGAAEIFTGIYEDNIWKNAESISGHGSTLEYTKGVRAALPVIFDQLKIRSMVDAPCGDFNWMRTVPLEGIRYCGIDIVPRLIDENNIRYGSGDIRFVCGDITRTTFPDADLLFCRDCLFHLSFSDIGGFLQSFVDSKIKYLMTTTHKNPYRFRNVDITTGDFRVIDLFQFPLGFPRDVLFHVDDYLAPDPPREMCIWSAQQIRASPFLRDARSNSQAV
jgi:methyltransferase family protein